MTKSSQTRTIPQTQDELRERFVRNGLEQKLSNNAEYHCEVDESFTLGLDREWSEVMNVRREEYKNRSDEKRIALIYWTKDEEPIINTLMDEGLRYKWNLVPASKAWSSYKQELS